MIVRGMVLRIDTQDKNCPMSKSDANTNNEKCLQQIK